MLAKFGDLWVSDDGVRAGTVAMYIGEKGGFRDLLTIWKARPQVWGQIGHTVRTSIDSHWVPYGPHTTFIFDETFPTLFTLDSD